MAQKISVIVPVYKAEKYISACIDSILGQTYNNWELILVVDGSPDDSSKICHSYESDLRIRVIDKDNGGVSSARNVGLDNSSGDYITFVDSDDYLVPNALETLLGLCDSEVDLVVGAIYNNYNDVIKPHKRNLSEGVYSYQELLPNFIDNGRLSGFCISSTCATLYSGSIIKNHHLRFNESLKNNEDGLFNFEYALYGRRVRVTDKCVYIYRKYNESSSNNISSNDNFNDVIYKTVIGLVGIEAYNLEVQFKRRKVTTTLWLIYFSFRGRGFIDNYRYIDSLLSSKELIESYIYIDVKNLSIHKKVFFLMMKYKLSFILAVIVRYIIPFLSSRITR